MRLALAGLALILVLCGIGMAVLTSIDMGPPTQKIERVIPDEHFPR